MDEERKPKSKAEPEAADSEERAADQPGSSDRAGKKPPPDSKSAEGQKPAPKAAKRPAPPPKPAPEATGDEGEPEEESGEPKAAPAKPAAKPAAKKPPPRRPVKGPQYEDLDESDDLLTDLQEHFPEAGITGQAFLGQNIYQVPADALFEVLIHLRDSPRWDFDYLVDLTVLDYLGDDLRFCLVYQLYSYPDGPLIRIKSRLQETEVAPSVTAIWKTADWLEREAYDMFGVEFSGHPDLRRILLPEDWHGFPLRKDYDIKLQDQAWIRKHLRIRKVPD